jgi:hypothetical protein
MVMHLTISFDTLVNTLIQNQSWRKSLVLTAKILLGLPFEHAPVPLSVMLVPRKKTSVMVHCDMLGD